MGKQEKERQNHKDQSPTDRQGSMIGIFLMVKCDRNFLRGPMVKSPNGIYFK